MVMELKNRCFLDSVIERAILVCPLCKGPLHFKWVARYRGEVERATIQCNSCGVRFEVVARIPVLLPPGQFADWTHPFVEMILDNIGISAEEAVEKYGVEKVKCLYAKLMRGEYKPSLSFKRAVDRRLVASGGRRVTKKAVERHFELIWRQTKGEKWFAEIVERAAAMRPERMLDECSGGGFFLACFLRRFTGYEQLYSIDIDYHCAKRIEGILKHYKITHNSLPIVADARALPFPSGYFDVITNNHGFGQILGYSRALRETLRVLRPGGRLIMAQEMGLTRLDGTKEVLRGFTVDELARIHKFGDIYVDKESFIGSLKGQGFLVDEIRDFGGCFVAVCSRRK
jgi:SAM-dependent methyltransferase/uncharacterized protein YbaR (Trm112 family)